MEWQDVLIVVLVIILVILIGRALKKNSGENFQLTKTEKSELSAGLPPEDPYRKDMGFTDVESDNYDEQIKFMGLDPSVQQSHAEFVNETNGMISSTSSHLTVKDDFTPAVPWMGLPRKAMYAVLGASDTSRTMQTETPEQTLEFAMHHSRGYDL